MVYANIRYINRAKNVNRCVLTLFVSGDSLMVSKNFTPL